MRKKTYKQIWKRLRCVYCGEQFKAKRLHATTCSSRCRLRLSRLRQKLRAEIEAEMRGREAFADSLLDRGR
jgi:hypothetical protein